MVRHANMYSVINEAIIHLLPESCLRQGYEMSDHYLHVHAICPSQKGGVWRVGFFNSWYSPT